MNVCGIVPSILMFDAMIIQSLTVSGVVMCLRQLHVQCDVCLIVDKSLVRNVHNQIVLRALPGIHVLL